jgi:UDP-N-acetylglucosamine 1-carboxyvinyltransferase
MIIAGLIAEGKTEISDIEYIDRGYEQVVEKLTAVGADIKRISDETADISLKAN